MVLIDAQIVAGMTRNVGTDRVVFEIRGLRALSRTDKALIDATARRYGGFLDLAATVTYSG